MTLREAIRITDSLTFLAEALDLDVINLAHRIALDDVEMMKYLYVAMNETEEFRKDAESEMNRRIDGTD